MRSGLMPSLIHHIARRDRPATPVVANGGPLSLRMRSGSPYCRNTCSKLRVYIGYLLAGQWIGMQEVAAGQWDVYLGPVRLGCFNEEEVRGPQKDYVSLRCYPCL